MPTGGLTPFGTLAGLGLRGAGPGDGGSASEGGGASIFSSPEPARVFGSGIAAGRGMFGGTTIDGGAVASAALSTREEISNKWAAARAGAARGPHTLQIHSQVFVTYHLNVAGAGAKRGGDLVLGAARS